MPQRIQRQQRTRIPDGVVYVGRPTKWANPFSSTWFLRHHFDARFALDLFRDTAGGFWVPAKTEQLPHFLQQMLYGYHKAWWGRFVAEGWMPFDAMHAELRGRDLACWCPLVDKNGEPVPCHADVLLELANQ